MFRLLLSTVLFLGISFCARAQFTKGQIYLGGASDLGLTTQFSPFGAALRIQTVESGVFLADRFLVGAEVIVGVGTARGAVDGTSTFRPFARVYFLNQNPRHPTAFAELGVGSLGTDRGSRLDVRPGAGLEIPLAPQIFGTLKFQYGIAPDDSNIAQLSFGMNAILNHLGADPGTAGGRADAGAQRVPVRRGQWMVDPQIGTLVYVRPAGGGTRLISGDISVRGGYIMSDDLMLLGGMRFFSGSNKSEVFEFLSTSVGADLGLRYLFPTDRSIQFFAGGKFSVQRFSFKSSNQFGNSSEFRDTNTALLPEAGLLFFLLDNLALAPSVSLNIPLGNNDIESTLMRVGVGIQFFFGGQAE